MPAPEPTPDLGRAPNGDATPNGTVTLRSHPAANGHSHSNGYANGHIADPITTNGSTVGSSSHLRRQILLLLREDGPLAPDQIAHQLGASRTGVLQQLRALESAQLVSRRTERHGVGRPRHLYDVTREAQDLFPSNYDGLAEGLIAAISVVGGESLVEQVFRARRVQSTARIRARMAERLTPDAPLVERVRELAVFQDEQGYLCQPVLDTNGGAIRLVEHNCAIYHVAMGYPAACAAELELFTDVLGADLVRESHIASGDRCCTYLIQERPET